MDAKAKAFMRESEVHDPKYIIFAVLAFECLGGKSSLSVLILAKALYYVYHRGKARCINDFVSELHTILSLQNIIFSDLHSQCMKSAL